MIRLDVRLYDGARIDFPMPLGSTWRDARRALVEVRREFAGTVLRAEIVQPQATPILERLDRTLVGAP